MSFPKKTLAILLLFAIPCVASARDGGGNLLGWVEDSRGMPVSGVLISVFSKGMRDGGFVTVSDGAGRFFLPSLPAGSYTLRALGQGHRPAPARQVTVLPNQDSIFSVSLRALDLTDEKVTARARELQWLERHKRRSVLEDRDDKPREDDDRAPAMADLAERLAPWLSDLKGSVEFAANSEVLGTPADPTLANAFPGGSGVVRLKGRITDSARFSLGGLLAEKGSRSWRMAGEFSVDPGGGHEVQLGTGYGTRLLHSPSSSEEDAESASVGAVFVQDRWSIGNRFVLTAGARHTYIGFVADRNHTDPIAIAEFSPGASMHLRGSFTSRTLAPGGDLLTLSTLAAAPAIAYAITDGGLRPQRTLHYEMAVSRELGQTLLEARTFREDTRDLLVNAFDRFRAGRSLHIVNGGGLSARGMGLEVSHRFGNVMRGSLGYTYGHGWSDSAGQARTFPFAEGGFAGFAREASYHDIAAQVETVFEWTDTRLVAYYRVNSLKGAASERVPMRATRFDIQLSQGLPFIGALTRTDWDLLVAFRNLFYEPREGGFLDEVTVVNPPTRMTGGISVRF